MERRPVLVGLAGAGPWASIMHAPLWSAGLETMLSGVWARRAEAAAALAAAYETEPVSSFDALLDRSDAIAFAVPPDVQWGLAIRAVRAGKHVILEKPLADSLDHARELAEAVEREGVGSLVLFTVRFDSDVREFLRRARSFDAIGARVAILTPAFLRGPFSDSPWRRQRGALLDIGPHALDLVTAALGPATRIGAHVSTGGWVAVHLDHAGGMASEMVLSGHVGLDPGRFDVELYGREGLLAISVQTSDLAALHATIRRELVDAVQGAEHPCNVRRGLYVQELIDAAERSLERGPILLGPG